MAKEDHTLSVVWGYADDVVYIRCDNCHANIRVDPIADILGFHLPLEYLNGIQLLHQSDVETKIELWIRDKLQEEFEKRLWSEANPNLGYVLGD